MMYSRGITLAVVGLIVVFLIFSGTFDGAVGAARDLWKFHRQAPHASIFVLLDINQEEDRVPIYTLPSPLLTVSGERIASAEQWEANRDALVDQFATHIYGKTPEESFPMQFRVIESSKLALDGKALRRQIELDIDGHRVIVLSYQPNEISVPAPAFLILNFRGNHTITEDPSVLLTESWVPLDKVNGVLSNHATDANRGQRAGRYPLESIIDRGYALVTAYYGDFYPDHLDGKADSVHGLFPRDGHTAEWGAIGAWAWGMSRMLDYLERDPGIDETRVIALGHSRLGKTALWAAAQDRRFAAAISNNSGAMGAALSRRQFGETVNMITEVFPHWFTAELKNYGRQEDRMPIDQHQLIALLAPRPVYVASASEDLWADPRGEFLAARAATDVYRLFGKHSENLETMPPAGAVLPGTVSYHLRAGKHDLQIFDWKNYLNFADCYVRRISPCQQKEHGQP